MRDVRTTYNKRLIISHIADVDGISAVILAKVHYDDKIDYGLVEFNELEDYLRMIVDDESYKQYDEIIITDVSFSQGALEIVDKNEELKRKIKHFDHHVSEKDQMEKYPFVNEVTELDGKKVCGTTLFYESIKNQFRYYSDFVRDYLQAVCDYDNGGPLCGNKFGVDLTTLFALIGIDLYMEKIQTAIEKRDYPFTDADYELIHQEYRRKEEYIEECDKKLTRINIGNYKVGVSISESYRSDVGNFLSRRYKDELDFILIFNPMRESFSFRTVRDDVNCGQIAKSLTPDGGGHPQAAGMPLNSKTIFILYEVLDAMKKKEEIKLERKQPQ